MTFRIKHYVSFSTLSVKIELKNCANGVFTEKINHDKILQNKICFMFLHTMWAKIWASVEDNVSLGTLTKFFDTFNILYWRLTMDGP